MGHHFQHQPELQITPIEKIRLPLKSGDELPPMLAGLQWVWMHPRWKDRSGRRRYQRWKDSGQEPT